MILPDDLRAMEPQRQTQLFLDLATELYGPVKLAEHVQRDFFVSRRSVYDWRNNHSVPPAIILALSAWLEFRRQAEQLSGLLDFAAAPLTAPALRDDAAA